MNPSQVKPDQFKSKWTVFHPQATVWVQNVLNHDVIFNVADEHNNSYQYRLPTGKISELPGGAVATLGVKAIVDELIQNNRDDVLRIWDSEVRAKYENEIVLKVKEAPLRDAHAQSGVIDLSLKNEPVEEEELPEVTTPDPAPGTGANYEPETAFPDRDQKVAADSAAKAKAKAAAANLPETAVVEE